VNAVKENNLCYVVKDGVLIEHELPQYGETVIVSMGGKVDRFETKIKRKL
jgi:hypothetical protein